MDSHALGQTQRGAAVSACVGLDLILVEVVATASAHFFDLGCAVDYLAIEFYSLTCFDHNDLSMFDNKRHR